LTFTAARVEASAQVRF